MTLLADTMVPVDAIMLDKYQVTIQSGKTVNLKVKYLPENATNKTIKWTSGNTNVARGFVRGCCQGKSNGNVSYNCKNSQRSNNSITVRVVPAESSALSIDKLSVSINPGEKEQLEAIFTPQSEDDKVIWKSDNTDVATVSETVW